MTGNSDVTIDQSNFTDCQVGTLSTQQVNILPSSAFWMKENVPVNVLATFSQGYYNRKTIVQNLALQ